MPGRGLNQVTFAFRPVGATTWTALGTDDNAPYRVFHDVRALAKGTLLEYRAVVRDHDGDLGVATSVASVGDVAAPVMGEPDLDGRFGRFGGRFIPETLIPACADLPRTEVLFAHTHDRIGPLGAKSMSESPFNPVAPAIANAIRDATGARLTQTPFAPDRIFAAIGAALAT